MTPFKTTDEWYKKAAESEEGQEISAGKELNLKCTHQFKEAKYIISCIHCGLVKVRKTSTYDTWGGE